MSEVDQSLSSAGLRFLHRAGCADVDPDLFFDEHRERQAAKVCAGCPVTVECLAYAMEWGFPYGVYGGLTPRERRNLRRRDSWSARDG